MRRRSRGRRRSVDRGKCRLGIELRNPYCPGCRRGDVTRKATSIDPPSRGSAESRGVADPMHAPKHFTREENPPVRKPGDPGFGLGFGPGPCRELERGTTAMDEPGKSDEFIVPVKSPNRADGAPRAAEGMEGRDSAKGNLAAAKQDRTQCRHCLSQEPRRVRRAAELPARHHPRQEPG